MRGIIDFDYRSKKYFFTHHEYRKALSCGTKIEVDIDSISTKGRTEHSSKIKNGYYFLYENGKIPLRIG
jgi:hypothetical protein